MADLSLVVKKPLLAKIEEIELDASVDEQHTFNNRVTQFPVESGATISDHIFVEPDRLSITGFITNTPIKAVESNLSRTVGTDAPSRVDSVFKELLRLRNEKVLLTVVTALNVYSDMAIVSLTVPRNAAIGVDTLRFTADLLKVTRVESEIVMAPASRINPVRGAESQGAPTTSKGKQSTTPANAAQEEQGSLLYRAFTWAARQ